MRTSIAARVASAGRTWPSVPVPKAPALRNLCQTNGGTGQFSELFVVIADIRQSQLGQKQYKVLYKNGTVPLYDSLCSLDFSCGVLAR